ncbi:MAG: EAL domain-containing protein [Methylococcaceae bacterium]|nr:EAL domain-containing protein [Methylococcaceae bacterium]MDD1607357.1 EAL domain-containing protein [Methylococcaceae bacterium]MDD1609752.1 EAL domain-containing protein [Methylococcaceae bacterium]MDD1615907.1 EAL domain-containing protein [Methylococcaceae bacterium]OYV19103.1 MAG: PAS/PAC and Chase sensor-containing diguanylate cyclase/phosphodiesterase [Methylococcaceae bacterium NSP1-2]
MNINDALPTNMIWLKQLSVATIYVLLGHTIHHYFTHNGIGIIWPGSGLALAVVLIGGKRYIWGVLLGSVLLHAPFKESLWAVSGISLANILQVFIGNWLLTRTDKSILSLNTLRDYLRLIILGGGVASLIAAIIAVWVLLLIKAIPSTAYFINVLYWWMANVLGVVLVAPLILAWGQTKPKPLTGRQGLEALLLVGITFIGGQVIFLGWFNESLTVQPKGFILFLFITWIAVRLGICAITLTLNMIAIQSLLSAYLKVGYFANDIGGSLYDYWFYMLILSGVGMTLTLYVNKLKQKELKLRKSEAHLRLSQTSGGIGTWETDLTTNKQTWSETYTDLVGFSAPSEPTWDDFLAIVYSKDRQQIINAMRAHIDHGTKYDVEYRVITANGDIRWMRSTGQVERNAKGKPIIMRGILQDVTERKQASQELHIAATAFESQEGMFITDANNMILRVNSAFTKITGYRPEEVIGKNPRILQSGRQDANFYATMWESIHHTGKWKGEIWNRRKNGKIYPQYLSISTVKGINDIVSNYIATLTDITKRKAAENEIERLAFYDPLTGLPNRRLLLDRLKQALATSTHSGKKGTLLFIDLDNFKILNDTLGHNIGDLLLQQVAERLTNCVRENDTVARLSGDEFVVILENLSKHLIEAGTQADIIGEKILLALNQPYQLATHRYYNTSSIGATLFNNHEQPIDELFKQADIAMYQAKTAGRNTLRFFDPEMQARITARVALEADLRLALAENQFKLYYQLQTTHDNQAIGAEVLIRWQHPQRGLVSPNDFITLAEETNLILPIGQWVLETACAQIKIWARNVQTQHLQLAVNVSARQFHQVDFVDMVRQALRYSAIRPELLKLELTESLILADIHDTIHKMNTLRKMGVRFSMDDFGTGYSSLAYLTQLPLDQLKIDQSFVHNIGVKPADAIIVQTIIGMANNLGIEVIAEGVETEAQRAFLELHGCALCQGYLFSKPVPIEQFEALLKQSEIMVKTN